MPTYAFRCTNCQEPVSSTMSITERDRRRIKHPKSGSGKVEPMFGPLFVKTARKRDGVGPVKGGDSMAKGKNAPKREAKKPKKTASTKK